MADLTSVSRRRYCIATCDYLLSGESELPFLEQDDSTVDGNCQTCPCLCKRLGPTDEPAHYHFAKLTPVDVIDLLETIAGDYNYWDLEIQKHQQSLGHQLALLFTAKKNWFGDINLLVIAQASSTPCG